MQHPVQKLNLDAFYIRYTVDILLILIAYSANDASVYIFLMASVWGWRGVVFRILSCVASIVDYC